MTEKQELHRTALTLTPTVGDPITYEFSWKDPITNLDDFLQAMAVAARAKPASPLHVATQYDESVTKFLKDWMGFLKDHQEVEGELLVARTGHRLSEALARELATHQHYKGGLYRVLGEGMHTETKEVMVIYEHLYPHERTIWLRPKEIFFSPVEETGAVRFVELKSAEPITYEEIADLFSDQPTGADQPRLGKDGQITLEYLLAKGYNMAVFEPRYGGSNVAVVIGGPMSLVGEMADCMTDGGDSCDHIQARLCGRYYPYGEGRNFPEALRRALAKLNAVPKEILDAVLRDVYNTNYNKENYEALTEIPNYLLPVDMPMDLPVPREDGTGHDVVLAAAYTNLDFGKAFRYPNYCERFTWTPDALEKIKTKLLPRAKAGALVGELDYPIYNLEDENSQSRYLTVDLNRACSVITDLRIVEDSLGGEDVQKLVGTVKPVGPYAKFCEEFLNSARPELRFGVRAWSTTGPGGVQHLEQVVTFDLINPGTPTIKKD